MKFILILLIGIFILPTCNQDTDSSLEEKAIKSLIKNWHQAATDANLEAYFGSFSKEAVFVGTDVDEVWSKTDFYSFSKPYFDKGKAWEFHIQKQNIYLDGSTLGHFDEILDTWMGLCRGSGVVIKENNKWKIKHYVLSVTAPNETIKKLTNLHHEHDSLWLFKNK